MFNSGNAAPSGGGSQKPERDLRGIHVELVKLSFFLPFPEIFRIICFFGRVLKFVHWQCIFGIMLHYSAHSQQGFIVCFLTYYIQIKTLI